MNLANLLDDRCPKCERRVVLDELAGTASCSGHGYVTLHCDFTVTLERLAELKAELEPPEGRKIINR